MVTGDSTATEGRIARLEGQVEQLGKRMDDLRWTINLWSALNTALLMAVLGLVIAKL